MFFGAVPAWMMRLVMTANPPLTTTVAIYLLLFRAANSHRRKGFLW
jgi:hypothetical protein